MTEAGVPAKPKKPAGWWSAEAKAQRREARLERKRLRRRAIAERERRKRIRAERVSALVAGMARVAAVKAERISKLAAAAKAKEPKGKKARKAKKRGAILLVPKTGDIVATLYRRGTIDGRGRRAAEHYREAYDVVHSAGMSGTLNPDKAGSGAAGRPHSERVLIAAEIMNGAARLLGELDGRTIREIIGEGRAVEDCARDWGEDAGVIRGRIKSALKLLADKWFPAAKQRDTIVAHRQPDAKPHDTSDSFRSEIAPGRVAHGASSGVAWSSSNSAARSGKRSAAK